MTYTPNVGDRVRLDHWDDGQWIEVRYVDRDTLYGRTEFNEPTTWERDEYWELVPPKPPAPTVRDGSWLWVADNGQMWTAPEDRGNARVTFITTHEGTWLPVLVDLDGVPLGRWEE